MKDFQQNKVYAWEHSVILPGQWVAYENCQSIIDYIWTDQGLANPPKVTPMSPNVTKWAGMANRLKVFLPKNGASTKTIVHELAHSMTMNVDGIGHLHGPRFVGLYMVLAEKYLNTPMALMMYVAREQGVKYDPYAKPAITDNEIQHMMGI